MNPSRWMSRQDLKSQIFEINGVDGPDTDDYFVSGEGPPPPRNLNEEDDEIALRYGSAGDHVPVNNENMKPDLHGITQMLRMVDKSNLSSRENVNQIKTESRSPGEIIVVSKLNPNVPAFIPNTSTHSSHRSNGQKLLKNDKEETCMEANPQKNIVETTNNVSLSKENEDEEKNIIKTDIRKKALAPPNEIEEKQRIEASLRKKIHETAKADNFKEKRDRNAAIIALIKLNSAPPKAVSPKLAPPNAGLHSPKPTLYPPEYFEGTSYSAVVCNIGSAKHCMPQVPDGTESPLATNSPKTVSNTDLTADTTSVTESSESDHLELIPAVQESIKKVNNWLEPKKTETKRYSPVVGPIEYKKKNSSPTNNATSPLPDPTASKPVRVTASYVPSAYASDLAKTYTERSKAKMVRGQDIWTKLENDCKARDEIIRRRLRDDQGEGSQVASSSTSQSSSRRRWL